MIGDLGSVVGVAIGVVLFFGAAALVVVKRLFHICSPNEVLVFSGGKSQVDGRSVGYRIVKGGAPSGRRCWSGSTGWTSRT